MIFYVISTMNVKNLGAFMKYLLLLTVACFVNLAMSRTNPTQLISDNAENCHYQTVDSHSVNPNHPLLAQIDASSFDQKKKKKNRKKSKRQRTGTGQR